MRAEREPIAVSSHGHITGYFVGPDEYEEFRRFRESRRSFATAELPEEKFEAIRASCTDPRNAYPIRYSIARGSRGAYRFKHPESALIISRTALLPIPLRFTPARFSAFTTRPGGSACDADRSGGHVVKGQGHRDAGVEAHQANDVGDALVAECGNRTVEKALWHPA